jgi:CheY-like chemotaxis protein
MEQVLAVDPATYLQGLKILVVEDSFVVAMDLANQLERCGCTVVGPEGRLRPALNAAWHEALDGAVLHVNLGGNYCFPVAGALTARKVRYIFASGYDSMSVWPPEYARIPRITKPYRFPELAELLVQHIAKHRYN